MTLPTPFSDVANPNPDPVKRLGEQCTVSLQVIRLAREIKDAKTEAEAEWRLDLLLGALSDIYKMRRARTAT